MVNTRKFSEFSDGGDLENDNTTVGLEAGANAQFNNPWTFLASGTTAERPAVDASMYYRLRLNTDMEHYEYYDPTLAMWLQIESSGDIANLIARLAAHTAGDGASMIGLLDQGAVSDKTVQDLAEADFIVKTDTTALANAIALSGLSTGFLVNETGTGNLVARELEGTVDQIDISDGTGLAANPQASIASNPTLPGSSHVIIPFGTTAQRPGVASNGYIRYNTTLDEIEFWDNNAGAWVQLGSSGAVFSVTGTANEIDVDNTDPANPIVGLSDTIDAPGTFTIQGSSVINEIINDDTMATAGTDNISTSLAIKNYVDNFAEGLTVKAAVETASTSDFDATYDNGASGVGATLTANSNGAFTQDGEAGVLDKSYLFKDQADAFENGVYVLTQVGDAGTPAILTRRDDFDQPDNIVRGSLVPVIAGTLNGGTKWVQTSDVDTVGTDSIDFTLWMINVNRIVTTDTTQTITGDKEFTGLVEVPTPATDPEAANKKYVDEKSGFNEIVLTNADSPYTWNKPAEFTDESFIEVTVIGAGGGGGGCSATSTGEASEGGGGGGGAVGSITISNSLLGSTETVTIGAGGAGGAAGNNNGSQGETSSFGSFVSCTGGGGGNGAIASSSASTQGGEGGTSTGGDLNTSGENGSYGIVRSERVQFHTEGGGNILAPSAVFRINVISGRNYGGGATGAARGAGGSALAGGDGADGLVIIREFI